MNTTHRPAGFTRRQFLATTGLALAAAPTLIPAHALGRGAEAPSNKIVVGIVGWGMQGPSNTEQLLAADACRVVAACDLDARHLKSAVDKVNGEYRNQDCKGYHDYREMLARKDIDAVMLAVPDNWHALMAVEAAKNGKDIYGEKPLARTIAEQQAIVRAVQTNKRIWQTGSWQRSQANFLKGAEIVRNGLIGKVTRVEVGLPSGHHDFAGTSGKLLEKLKQLDVPNKPTSLTQLVPGGPGWDLAVSQPPAEFDYELWLGPAQQQPYIEQRVFMNWRWDYNIGGGQLLDWIGHHCDIGHWGLGNDDTIGPLEVEGKGQFPPRNAVWNTASVYRVTCKYPNDVTLVIGGGQSDIRGGTRWIGTDGWVQVDRGHFSASNPEWTKWRRVPEADRKVSLIESRNHMLNFLDSIKSRQPTITPVEVAHHSAIPGHLGLIAMLTGRKITWDAQKEVIVGDAEASKLLSREYRAPWKLA